MQKYFDVDRPDLLSSRHSQVHMMAYPKPYSYIATNPFDELDQGRTCQPRGVTSSRYVVASEGQCAQTSLLCPTTIVCVGCARTPSLVRVGNHIISYVLVQARNTRSESRRLGPLAVLTHPLSMFDHVIRAKAKLQTPSLLSIPAELETCTLITVPTISAPLRPAIASGVFRTPSTAASKVLPKAPAVAPMIQATGNGFGGMPYVEDWDVEMYV